MDTITILRELRRRRIMVGVVAAVAILVGLMLTYRPSLPPDSRKYEVGIASGQILVDTPDSQVVDVTPRGVATLGARARLLANLLTEGEVKEAIARRAGLDPDQLLTVSEATVEPPPVPSSAANDPDAHLLTTRLVRNLPIIEIEAQAPDAAQAAGLANAAIGGLRAYLDSKAAAEDVSDARRLRVSGLGPPQASEVVRGPRRLLGLGAVIFIFLTGCAVILIAPALARGWRVASEQDALGDREAEPRAASSSAGWSWSGWWRPPPPPPCP